MAISTLAAIFIISSPLLAQVEREKKPHPGVDQNRIANALSKGAQWLLAESHPRDYKVNGHKTRSHELVLYTLMHAGADQNSPKFQALLKEVLGTPLERLAYVVHDAREDPALGSR